MNFNSQISSEDKKIIEMYCKYNTYNKVAKELGISCAKVKRTIVEYGFPPRTKEDQNSTMSIAKEVFWYEDKILGYLCGWVASDGCLARSRKAISLQLATDDREALETFRRFTVLNPNQVQITTNRLPTETTKGMLALNVVLPRLYDFCISIGITPAKSKTLDVNLEGQTDEFKWYFLRGLIDGDGHVSLTENLGGCRIGVASASKDMIDTIVSIFGGAVTTKNTYTGNPVYSVNFNSKFAQQLLTKLPMDEFCLKRKTLKMEQLKLKTLEKPWPRNLVGTIWPDGYISPSPSLRERWMLSNSGVPYKTFLARLRKGMSEEEALTKPTPSRDIKEHWLKSDRSLTYAIVLYRVTDKGMSIEEALSLPRRANNKKPRSVKN